MIATIFAASLLAPFTETRVYTLHKFMQPIGRETDTIEGKGSSVETKIAFSFTDRGSPAKCTARFLADGHHTGQSLLIQGTVARFVKIDNEAMVSNGKVTFRVGKAATETAPLPAHYALVSGYAPVGMQGEMVKAWIQAGRPASLPTFPKGAVSLKQTATDAFTLSGKPLKLKRIVVRGLLWGIETLWTDEHDDLVAVMTRDAEFDHFEAVAERYEPLLNQFAGLAGKDSTEELARVSKGAFTIPKKPVAFVGGRLFAATGDESIEDSVVLVKGGRIVAAGPRSQVSVPADAQVIDTKGCTVMPGLWDMHAHYEQAEWGPVYLAAGVTSVRDCGNVFEFITSVRDAIAKGRGIGPRLFLAGIVDGDSPVALGVQRVNNADDAMKWVKRYHDAGFLQMKIYSSVKPGVVKAVCEEAHKVGMTVTGHIPDGMTIHDGLAAGMDMVNHIDYLMDLAGKPDALAEQLREMQERGTVYDPTVALTELFLHDSSIPQTSVEPGIAKVAPELHDTLISLAAGGPPARAKFLDSAMDVLRQLIKSGVTVVAGTDQSVPGHSLHREIELYVKAGMTPAQAIRSATSVPAKALKQDKELGTLEAGKMADLIVVEGDPLAHIEDTRRVRTVMANGRLYDPGRLWKLAGFQP
ncbi:MAG: amidohydrolase family protein [Armatimonadetes bacterium]|nr:amidohydrolase family protein [Armatimonadota bacterium]